LKIDLNTGKSRSNSISIEIFWRRYCHFARYYLPIDVHRESGVRVHNGFQKVKEFTITTDNGQGWGMTTDGTHLVVDDGSSNLYFMNLQLLS
jgi:hypothetical protein